VNPASPLSREDREGNKAAKSFRKILNVVWQRKSQTPHQFSHVSIATFFVAMRPIRIEVPPYANNP
jgi:hypothetical protein